MMTKDSHRKRHHRDNVVNNATMSLFLLLLLLLHDVRWFGEAFLVVPIPTARTTSNKRSEKVPNTPPPLHDLQQQQFTQRRRIGSYFRFISSPLLLLPPQVPIKRTSIWAAQNNRYNQVAKRQQQQQDLLDDQWFPRATKTCVVYDDDIYGTASSDDDGNNNNECVDEDYYYQIERKAVKLLANLIQQRLNSNNYCNNTAHETKNPAEETVDKNINNYYNDTPPTKATSLMSDGTTTTTLLLRNNYSQLVQGRFMDLTCTQEGERALEQLFCSEIMEEEKEKSGCDEATTNEYEQVAVIQAAVIALQSLLILGTQVGVKGSPVQLQRMIAHLDSRANQETFLLRDLETWDTDSVRRLKYRLDKRPGIQVLSELKWKQSTQGAFDLLVAIGAWGKHEDVALLRSGFSLRFSEKELEAAETASKSTRDLDEVLGLRQDLRHLKVFTIDSADTSEIDDGISLEKYQGEDGSERRRIWIHIADGERFCPRNSELFEIARMRVTSLYLPQGSIPMLPPKASDDLMSLTMNKDAYALSLGVELRDDGSIDNSSLVVTPSIIRVSYRLTYDEVDEMLEEGIGYNEEWELGALLDFATGRREYRIKQGSSEGFVPTPIPQKTVKISADADAPDGIKVEVNVQATHNSGTNQTTGAEARESSQQLASSIVDPVSSAYTLVTEAMILAGEAIGRWKLLQDKLQEDRSGKEGKAPFRNEVRLPFRTQRKPDYTSRARERNMMHSLIAYNVGGGYCHAWYCRRFLSAVKVMETCAPHSGLGLDSYVQWTSPIRRYSDLMVHVSVKRYLRRQRIIEQFIEQGRDIQELNLKEDDIGCPIPVRTDSENGEYEWNTSYMDADIDFLEGAGLVGASRILQRNSEQYWLFEYIRRIHEKYPDKTWNALVLGFIGTGEKSKKQYAIYIYELGFEYKVASPIDLSSGIELKLRISIISPRAGQLAFVRTNC